MDQIISCFCVWLSVWLDLLCADWHGLRPNLPWHTFLVEQNEDLLQAFKDKGTLLVTYTAYSEMCSLHLSQRGAVGSHSAAPGDWLQILSLGQGDWLETYMHVLMVGETGPTRGNPREHEENMRTPRRKALLQPRIEPRTFLLWSDSANYNDTVAGTALHC